MGNDITGITSVGVLFDDQGVKYSPYLLADVGEHSPSFHTYLAKHNELTLDVYPVQGGMFCYAVTAGKIGANGQNEFGFSFHVRCADHEEFSEALAETGGHWFLITTVDGFSESRLIDKNGKIIAHGSDNDGAGTPFKQVHVAI